MGTLVINTFLTLDGVAQAPGAPDEDGSNDFTHGGWQVPLFTDQVGEIVGRWQQLDGGLLLGRKTYDIFAAHWPHIADDHEHAEIARSLNAAPKYVASRTVTSLAWQNSTLLGADVPAEVAALKEKQDLHVIGSLDLAQTLIRHDLIDEYRLMVFPVVLGTGKRLFADGAVPATLELVSTETTDKGVIASVYRSAGKVSYGSFA
ncbi:dihydrofolate reductase family protein [Actinophytocola sp.]|uniref:dihydrofolate reductase family protein n=1 Tax=Actinophytocola sp. TaxID=1872138 RepID=UPI002ED3A49E